MKIGVSPAAQEKQDLRERLLSILLRVLAATGLVALVPSVYLSIKVGLWLVLVADCAASAIAVVLILLPRVSFRFRTFALLFLAYGLGFILLWVIGPYGAGYLYLLAFVFLAALFGSRRAVVGANLLAVLTYIAYVICLALNILPFEQALDSAVVISANYVMIGAILSASVHHVINGYADAASEERRMRTVLELMVREIEHRVKNNLQVILSIVNLKSRPGTDPAQSIADIKASLSAISSVHSLLYRSGDVYLIKLSAFLRELMGRFRHYSENVEFSSVWLGQEAELEGEKAVTLGLLVNEIVTNSLKHAFAPGERGRVFVEAEHEGQSGLIRMRIGDDGRGLQAGESGSDAKAGQGREIIGPLARQLGAELRIEDGPGCVHLLSFTLTGAPPQRRH